MAIWAGHYYSFSLKSDSPPVASHELVRRMSPLQRALLGAMETFSRHEGEAFKYVIKDSNFPIYFATSLGELDANLKVTDALRDSSIPLSPTAFQNSVHNAAPGCLAIIYGIHSPSLTFSSGYASPDRVLLLAQQHLDLGLHDCICIAAGNENYPKEAEEAAFAELFVLFSDKACGPLTRSLQLLNTVHKSATSCQQGDVNVTEVDFQIYQEPVSLGGENQSRFSTLFGTCPEKLLAGRQHRRVVQELDGDRFESCWKQAQI